MLKSPILWQERRALLVAQLIKNRPAMQETPVWFLGLGRSPEEGIGYLLQYSWASLVTQTVKNPPAKRETQLIPGLGRSPGEGHSNPLQYSCLDNPMFTGAWWATVHWVAKSQTWPSNWAPYTHKGSDYYQNNELKLETAMYNSA